jgi:hypothetical protein
VNDNEDKNKISKESVEQFAIILVALIDEIHTLKKEDSMSSSEEDYKLNIK